jgi:TonB family protein
MAPLPPLTPPPPETPGSRVRVRTRSTISEEIAAGSASAEIIMAKLRGMIARGGQETDAILGTIAVAAHALTGANGAAIAMPRGGEVVCVGRSGELAPELGDLLNVDSGISGECLRTGTIMRCDDASRDFHVDAEVCRQMGLQSIAVVPLRGQYGRVGVLETFSAQSYAFGEDHMDLLGRLAGLAETAWAQAPESRELTPLPAEEAGIREFNADESVAEQAFHVQPVQAESLPIAAPVQTEVWTKKPGLAGASAALARVAQVITTSLHAEHRQERRWRYGTIIGLATVLLILLAVLGWKVWYRAGLRSRSANSSQAAVSSSPDGGTGVGLAWQPGAEQVISQPGSAAAARRPAPGTLLSPASPSRVTKSPAAVRPMDAATQPNLLVQGPPDRGQTTTIVADAPQMPAPDSGSNKLEPLLPASPSLPRLMVPISQGVSGGTLLHKVMPVYPSEARQLHVQGTVVLDATINEQGQMEDVKLVSGSPLLVQAAMDAVRKWRYSPYLLNGKPVKKETQVSITFIP